MKKGVETKLRLQEAMSAKIFDNLKESQPERLAVVDVGTGDITKEHFGLSHPDMNKLFDEVELVFHSAATIRFDEKLTEAVKLNVGAVYTLIELCKLMKKLQVAPNILLFAGRTLVKQFSNIVEVQTRPELLFPGSGSYLHGLLQH